MMHLFRAQAFSFTSGGCGGGCGEGRRERELSESAVSPASARPVESLTGAIPPIRSSRWRLTETQGASQRRSRHQNTARAAQACLTTSLTKRKKS